MRPLLCSGAEVVAAELPDGVQPFHAWYQASSAISKLGKVIVVGAPRHVAERFGLESAADLSRALSSARDFAGKDASMAALVLPPAFGVSVG